MPVLLRAPNRQPWVTTQPRTEAILQSTYPARTFKTSPTFVRRWMPTSSFAAAAVTESSPVSPTIQKPSNEVVGGAFVGAFLGLLLILLLLKCCRDRGHDGSDKSSSSSNSASSSPRPHPSVLSQSFHGPGPIYPPPVHEAPSQPPRGDPEPIRPSRTKAPAYISEREGRPSLVVRRPPSPSRPGRHGRANLESLSSGSGKYKGKVSFLL
jgi:hypothetical protein